MSSRPASLSEVGTSLQNEFCLNKTKIKVKMCKGRERENEVRGKNKTMFTERHVLFITWGKEERPLRREGWRRAASGCCSSRDC